MENSFLISSKQRSFSRNYLFFKIEVVAFHGCMFNIRAWNASNIGPRVGLNVVFMTIFGCVSRLCC
jgi:hypothetical protein